MKSIKNVLIMLVFLASFSVMAHKAEAFLTSQLDLGSTGSQVTELQTYYATDASIYPAGLVTGYFGPLTQAATQRFQAAQGIVSAGTPATTGFGRVGPQTMAKINALMGGGTAQIPLEWDMAPILGTVTVTQTSTNANFTWTTSEATQGQVYYDTVPLRTEEATAPKQQPFVSGAYVTDNGGSIGHNITVINLKPDTLYYYLIRGVDNTSNMSMGVPATFRTNK